jgi:hypothetical protein
MPADVADERTVKAWDMSNPSICQSERWPDDWCAKAIAVGSGGFTNLDTQEVTVRMISFGDEATAAGLFRGKGTADEVGETPPGDEIDGYESVGAAERWAGKGFSVRQGAVIADVEYAWTEGTEEPDRLTNITRMVVERVKQAQRGEKPTTSLR